MAAKEKLEAILNVALRVPSIMLLDVLYRWDVSSFFQQIQRSSLHNNPLFQYKYLALNMHYVEVILAQLKYVIVWPKSRDFHFRMKQKGYILSVVLLTLPRQHLVQLYLYFLTALLLYAGHQISRDYVRSELESGYEGPMYLEPLSMNRFMTALVGQLVVCTLCSCVMKTKQIWLFSAHMLPLLARLCLVPLETIVVINKFAMIFTGLEVLYFLASNLLVPYNLAKSAYRELVQVVEVYGLLALGMSLWNQLVVPVLFMVFWLVLFALQIYSYFSTRDQPASRERLLFLFLTSIAECCSTPYSLLGLVFTVSFVALGVLTLCKFYLQGYRAFMNDPAMNRGMTEGVTLLILAVQTGLIELQVVHRAFLLSIILFIVVASILQSMLEIADPIVLALGASRDKSLWKHFRAVSLCLFLLVFPAYMAYMICQFFHMDFWLLIIISSSILTSLQVLGTLFIYVLFMVEEFRKEPVENMDDVIYYVNGTYRLLEFLVALCVVAYGVSETIFGEWTVMGSVIIFIHSYYNVWLRAQLGWKSFLLRRDAVNKIKSLPTATKEQLEQHNDICAICYQDMKSAVITPCSHFFHAGCLKKWLYVQETCPLCHCQLKNPSQVPGLASEPVQQPNPGAEQNTSPGDAAEPPGVERDNGPNIKDSPSKSNRQVADGQDSQEASAEAEGSPSMDCDASPCEASQGAAFAAELIATPEGCPAQDPRVCVQL
ncbi:RING finger protein 145 isoform X2 [Apteryx rowi]|uniref:RING finger protein 145 isoform X2 n=1 Tax=Apteryx rowi TaxID=308060 RepID=UPI0006B0780F|nr:PREDICTED: RING finger protein 145 isoform X1 [Apteryx mantelli mantelli]XP_013799080.1 PREDICTED: RING finger protein 145 isoform X1 [Apteryx mantelli mantelli]XP_013799081.1 PREDICTED: RING finger protein 145 isoform X1 [Apteryx mantelli mantelli]XP_025918969.1 RING finger protein 145 isoform X2 [Apteryx rowi]